MMLALYDRRRSRNLQDMVQERRDIRSNLEWETKQLFVARLYMLRRFVICFKHLF
jgi:hypothetical protein